MLKFIAFILLGVLIYGSSLSNGFVLDDENQIVSNELTTSLGHFDEIFFHGAATHEGGRANSYGIYYRPLMLASFALLRSAFGLDARPFHTLQLLLHICTAMLLFLLFKNFAPPSLALIGGLFFLAHPMNVEAVCYVASLQDPLYALFGLAALVLVLQVKTFKWSHTLSLAALFLLALLGKETAAVFVLLAPLAAAFFRRDRLIKTVLAGALGTAIYLGLRIGFAGLISVNHSTSQLAKAPYLTKLMTVPLILASYLAKFFFPLTLASSQDWIVASPGFDTFWLPLGFVLLATFLCVLYSVLDCLHWGKRTWLSPFTYFFAWTVISLGLHSQILVTLDGTVSERWFYLPCMGLTGMAVSIASNHQDFILKNYRLTVALATAVILVFSGRSFWRTQDWHDGYTLYAADLVSQADSPTLQNNFGVELFRRGNFDSAKEHFEKSIELNPQWNTSWNNLGAIYQRTHNLQKAEECYTNSTHYGAYLLAYQNLASVLLQEAKIVEASSFLNEKALAIFPVDATLQAYAKMAKAALDRQANESKSINSTSDKTPPLSLRH